MAVRTRDELMAQIKERITGDDDQSLSFIEDITDTLNDYDSRIKESGNWKEKYETNDAEWRQRYRDRFFGTGDDPAAEETKGTEADNDFDEPETPTTYDDLFTVED